MIVSSRNSLSNQVSSLGTLLSSSERFSKVRIKVISGAIDIGDSNMTTGNEAGLRIVASDGVFTLEFSCVDDPATNLFIGTNSSATITILAY